MKKFLSLILALAMVMSVMSFSVFAEESVMPEAINGVITLTSDVTLTETFFVNEDEELVIDLNGHKLTITSPSTTYVINNHGDLTIMDSVGTGSIDARGMYNGYGVDGNHNSEATLLVESGTFNALGTDGGAAIFNYGDVTINCGAFTSIGGYSLNNQPGASMTIAGNVTANNGIYASNATLVVNGGEIEGNRSGCHVLYAWNSDVEINGGSFYNKNSGNATIMAAGTTAMEINGGTFGIADGRLPGNGNTWTSCLTDTQNTAKLTVNGGTFNGGFRVQSGTEMEINGGTFNDIYGSNYNIYGTVTVNKGTFTDDTAKAFAKKYIAADSNFDANTGVVASKVADVDGVVYYSLTDALKAVKENSVVTLLDNVTFEGKWDCRNTGSKTTVPFTFDGNRYTIKIVGEINDGYNHLAVFRAEAAATFKNTTFDMSEAISVFQNRFSVISSMDADLTVANCNFIGNADATAARAIIYGETAEHNNAKVVVSGCTFKNFKYGVTDNLNGKDVASVKVTESEFTNASVNVSASKEVTITDNNVDGGFVKVASYTQSPEQNLTVTVKDNELDEEFAADNQILAGTVIDAQEGFGLPVAEINGKKYMSLTSAVKAAKDGDIIYLEPGTYEDVLEINKSITITGAPKATTFAATNSEKPVIKIANVTNGGVKYHTSNVKFDNLVFEIVDGATGSGWNVSALGYYYENTANKEGLTVTNCDFINNSDLAIGAIAANIGKYTITNNTFKDFTTAIWSYVDHGAADEIIVKDNTFENVPTFANIYHGAPANGNANLTITNNKAEVDGEVSEINFTDFGQTKSDPKTAYNNVVITDNDADVLLVNASGAFNSTIEDNGAVVYAYASEAILRALEEAGVPNGDVYVNYGTDKETIFKVVEGKVYGEAKTLAVDFELASEAEGEKIYNINLKANDKDIINRLNSADLTFLFSQVNGANDYEIIASNSEVAINAVDNSKVRYEFHYNGKDDVATDTDTVITIGQVKFTGYGEFSFAVDSSVNTNAAHSTTMVDNIVSSFVPNGNMAEGEGELYISDDTIKNVVIAVPVRTLTINIDFPNEVKDQGALYQDMKVEITGNIDGVNQTVKYDLGKDEYKMVDGAYVITEKRLVLNNAYTVTVSGAGYRTARYTVTMTDNKVLKFWNNVMDEAQVVEIGKDSSKVNVTFLAGDIVKDNKINIYDLSAVVSYFGTVTKTEVKDAYAKYDLNRDGVIDSKDVAYVLVSWNN